MPECDSGVVVLPWSSRRSQNHAADAHRIRLFRLLRFLDPALFAGETFSQTVARIRLRRNIAGGTFGSDPRKANGRANVAAERAKCRSANFATTRPMCRGICNDDASSRTGEHRDRAAAAGRGFA